MRERIRRGSIVLACVVVWVAALVVAPSALGALNFAPATPSTTAGR